MTLKERVQTIEQLHAKLTGPEQELALAIALGYTNEELRQLLGKSTASVYRKTDDLGYTIFYDSPTLDYTNRGMLAAWGFLHRDCCLPAFGELT